MSKKMHNLEAATTYGITDSIPHPLPWFEGGILTEEPELMKAGEAIQEWDLARKAPVTIKDLIAAVK